MRTLRQPINIFKYSGEQSHVTECVDCFTLSIWHSLSLLVFTIQSESESKSKCKRFHLGLVRFLLYRIRFVLLFSFLSLSLQLFVTLIYLFIMRLFLLSGRKQNLNLALKNFPFEIRCEPHFSIRSVFDAYLPYSEYRIWNYLPFEAYQIYIHNDGLPHNCNGKTLFVVERFFANKSGNRKERSAKKPNEFSCCHMLFTPLFYSWHKVRTEKLRKLLKFGEV